MTDTTPDERATYTRLFASRGFASLLGVSLANVLGTSLQMLALSVLVYARTGSALWSSAAFAAGFLPQLIGGAVLTSLADRLPTRRLLAAGAALRAAAAALLALVDLPPATAIAVVAAVAVVAPVPSAAQSALVARLLPGELYVLGRSVFNLVSSGAQLLGLAVGGAVVALLGPHATLGVACGVQLVGLLAITSLPSTDRPAVAAGRWSPGETWAGNGVLLRDRTVRHLALSWWVPTSLLVGAEALVVAYVGEQGGTAATSGLLLAAFPAGAAVGDLVVGRWVAPRWRRRSVPWLFAAVGVALFPLMTQPPTPVAFGCFAAASAATAYQLGGQQLLLAAVPEARQGLAFGLLATGTMTGQGLVPVLSGALADLTGAPVAMGAMGVGVLVAWVFVGRLPELPAAGESLVADEGSVVAVEVPQVELGVGEERRPVVDER